MDSNVILVPVDFTSVAKTAISYAERMASDLNASIHLLHIVDDQDKIDDANKKLNEWVSGVNASTEVKGSVRVGSIFEDITDMAAEVKAKLVIMGTHGKKGMQKVTGSFALKIINNSKIPFLVVQDKKCPDAIKNIVFPIDIASETKEKIKATAFYAKQMGAKVHMFTQKSDDKFDKAAIGANVLSAKKFFKEHNISFDTQSASGKHFVEDLLHHTVATDADMVAIVNLNYKNFTNFFGNREEELLFNEAQLPILIINPEMSNIYDTVNAHF